VRVGLVLGVLLALAPRAEAWGFAAHREVTRLAIESLPEPLASLFRRNADYLVEHSIDPDLWRAAGRPGEDPNHYLDLDAFGAYPFADIPHVEAEHLARHGAAAAAKGRLPWRVAEVQRELVEAFRDRDPARALTSAAALSHYVGDAHVPLHATVNHDGQLSGQTGLHARWETALFERFEVQIEKDLHPAAAHVIGDPVDAIFDVLTEGYRDSLQVLASDRACVGEKDLAETPEDDRYDDRYYSRLYEREAVRLRTRLRASAETVGSFWLSAWQKAGRPELDPRFRFPYVRRSAKAVLVSLDGAAAPLLDDAVTRGLMPKLARLRREGATARGALTSLPCKTPAGHAALFTGAWSDRNGIAGSEVPVPGASVLSSMSGYSSTALTAEPLWVTAARQGLDVSVTSATQLYPFGPYLEERRFGGNFGHNLTLLDGYQAPGVHAAVYTARDLRLRPSVGWSGPLPAHMGEAKDFDLVVDGARLDGLVYDDPADPVRGFDTMRLSLGKGAGQGIVLKPGPAQGTDHFANLTVRARQGDFGLHFRLFSLAPDASEILLFRAESRLIHSNKLLVETAALAATRGFIGNGADDLYKAGALGPTIARGGDGTAEARYLETVALVALQSRKLFDFALEHTLWDLLIAYLPYPDEALHSWFGYLDPTLPGHDAAMAARLRPFMDQVLQIVDDYVGHIRERAGADAIVAIAGDHGMVGTNRTVQFNVALQKAGLLSLAADGSIDLFRTRAVYFPGNQGYFLVNRVGHQEGVVRPEEEDAVLQQLDGVLRRIQDPETGAPIVTGILDPRTWKGDPGIGGPQGGDLYMSLAPGYRASADLKGNVVEAIPPAGEHMLDPERPDMQVAFVMAGPGVSQGADLGAIRQVDIAPTLCALLGIDPPAQAAGSVLAAALARPGFEQGGAASRPPGPPARSRE